MKLFKRSNEYKASNVTYSVDNNEAYSYDWWCFFKNINGKNVFNNYSYSPSTCGHQYKVRRLLSELGIKIDMEISCPAGLQSDKAVASVKEYYSREILKLEQAINKPRSQKKKNEERAKQMQELAQTSAAFYSLNKGI